MPLEFKPCCQAMTMMYNPEKIPFNGFTLSNFSGEFLKVETGTTFTPIDRCPHCEAEIRTEEREIRNYTDFDPPCCFKECETRSTVRWSTTMSGYEVTLACCDTHQNVAGKIAERLQSI